MSESIGSRLAMTLVASVLATAALVAGPAAAERLVTAGGNVIETRGPWEVRGKTVVFTTSKGTLSSMRASEIDFDATEAANRPATEAPTAIEPPPERREPVLVLTDDDIGPGSAALASPPADADADAGSEADQGTPNESSQDAEAAETDIQEDAVASVFVPADRLEIRNWRALDDGQIGGIELVGTLVNRGASVVVDLGVTVRFVGREGEESHEAFVGSPTVGPGRAVDFRIPLPNIVTPPDEPTFEVHGRGLRPKILGSADKLAVEEASPEG